MGGEGGVSDFFLRFQSYYFGYSGPHAKFQIRSLAPSRLKGVRWEKKKMLLKLKASLASAEVSAGVLAKADQHTRDKQSVKQRFRGINMSHETKDKIHLHDCVNELKSV